MNDYETLLRAAYILRRDSRRPRSIILAVICRVLRDHAESLAVSR